jgi:hypothetical protein
MLLTLAVYPNGVKDDSQGQSDQRERRPWKIERKIALKGQNNN